MNHTYTLTQRPFVDPFLTQGVLDETVTVTDARTLTVRGSRLELVDGEPDLPVGEDVKVWRDRWFRCKPVADLVTHEDEIKAQEAARTQREAAVREEAVTGYLESAQAVAQRPGEAQAFGEFLEVLWSAQKGVLRDIKAFSQALDPVQAQVAEDARVKLSVIEQAQAVMVDALMAHLGHAQSVTFVSAYAYSPREGGKNGYHNPGAVHVMVEEGFLNNGRFKRHKGDALCKGSHRFWDMFPSARPVTCRLCVRRLLALLDQTH